MSVVVLESSITAVVVGKSSVERDVAVVFAPLVLHETTVEAIPPTLICTVYEQSLERVATGRMVELHYAAIEETIVVSTDVYQKVSSDATAIAPPTRELHDIVIFEINANFPAKFLDNTESSFLPESIADIASHKLFETSVEELSFVTLQIVREISSITVIPTHDLLEASVEMVTQPKQHMKRIPEFHKINVKIKKTACEDSARSLWNLAYW